MSTDLPEPPDGTRIEFEHWTDVYAAWRDDTSSAQAGWPTGDGGKVWCMYGRSVPQTWAELCNEYGTEDLALAVRLMPHPDDLAKRERWLTQVWAREGSPAERANRHPPKAAAPGGSGRGETGGQAGDARG
jgi:hypothetical protein